MNWFEFVEPRRHLRIAVFGFACATSAARLGTGQVVAQPFEVSLLGDEVVGEQVAEGVFGPAVDGDVGDEVFVRRAEREVDGAVLVHVLVHVHEPSLSQPSAEFVLRRDSRAVLRPFVLKGVACRVVEAV